MHLASGQLQLHAADACHWSPPRGWQPDLIIVKDTLEHLPDHDCSLARMARWLAPGGRIFLSFPPWAMPFGGHQQLLRHPVLCRAPWIHLLPWSWLEKLLGWVGEPEPVCATLREIRRNRVHLGALESIVLEHRWRVIERTLWLTNPIYALKFHLPAIRWPGWWSRLRGVRDATSTAAYYVLEVCETPSSPSSAGAAGNPSA